MTEQKILEIMQENKKYKSLEEELSIDLPTLFKALKNGIWYNPTDDFFYKPRLYYSIDYNCWCFELALGAYITKLKDYGTKWSLRKEDLEDD